MLLKNKTVVITGCNRGIGFAILKTFLINGANVIACTRKNNKKLKNDLEKLFPKNPENPLIRDLIIEGLSLARTQKEEFASILSSNNNDINALFSKLEEFINK